MLRDDGASASTTEVAKMKATATMLYNRPSGPAQPLPAGTTAPPATIPGTINAQGGVPIKFGFSLSDYYELAGEDSAFGYFQGGGLITLPLSDGTGKYGSWNLHGGVDFYAFGDTTKAFNNGDSGKVVASFGVGVVY